MKRGALRPSGGRGRTAPISRAIFDARPRLFLECQRPCTGRATPPHAASAAGCRGASRGGCAVQRSCSPRGLLRPAWSTLDGLDGGQDDRDLPPGRGVRPVRSATAARRAPGCLPRRRPAAHGLRAVRSARHPRGLAARGRGAAREPARAASRSAAARCWGACGSCASRSERAQRAGGFCIGVSLASSRRASARRRHSSGRASNASGRGTDEQWAGIEPSEHAQPTGTASAATEPPAWRTRRAGGSAAETRSSGYGAGNAAAGARARGRGRRGSRGAAGA